MIDTSVLGLRVAARTRRPAPAAAPLTDLAGALGLPAHRPHDAIGDALTTAQVFLALATHLDAARAQTVRSLTSAERRLQALLAYQSR